jgi:hypothetical protein
MASTVIDNLGVMDAESSVNGSLTLTYTAPVLNKNKTVKTAGSLNYAFGATGAEGKFTDKVTQNTGALDVAFEFEIVGQALTVVDADAENPLNALKLGPVSAIEGANIYVTDGEGGPLALGPSFFETVPNSYDAATSSATLQPGTYYEYIAGTAAPGKTDLNVGAFAGEAVPEPASWALMMFGVGMVGAGLRKRAPMKVAIA